RELGRVGRWAPILFVLLYAFATVLFVPGAILTVAGGALFGPLWGTLWNLIGATVGATFAFAIARYVGSDWVAARAGARMTRLVRRLRRQRYAEIKGTIVTFEGLRGAGRALPHKFQKGASSKCSFRAAGWKVGENQGFRSRRFEL